MTSAHAENVTEDAVFNLEVALLLDRGCKTAAEALHSINNNKDQSLAHRPKKDFRWANEPTQAAKAKQQRAIRISKPRADQTSTNFELGWGPGGAVLQ